MCLGRKTGMDVGFDTGSPSLVLGEGGKSPEQDLRVPYRLWRETQDHVHQLIDPGVELVPLNHIVNEVALLGSRCGKWLAGQAESSQERFTGLAK